MLGNILFLANKFDEMSRHFLNRPMRDVISGEDWLLIAFGQMLLIVGYVGFLKTYAPPGKFTRITFGVFGWGGMIVAVGHSSFMDGMPDELFALVLLGMMLMVPGLILFGISNLRKPVMARWKWLPLFTGLTGFTGFFLFSGEEITATFLVFRTLFTLGLVGMGIVLGLEKPRNADMLFPEKRTMKLIPFLLIYLLLTACVRAPESIPLEPVDPSKSTLYFNGVILTMDETHSTAEAIMVRGEKIEAVGANDEILALQDAATTLIDLNGRVLMPGFVDAHTHILNDARSQGMTLDEAQYQALKNGITSLGTLYVNEDFLQEIQAFNTAGYLRVRTSLYLVATDPCGNQQGDWWKDYPPTRNPGEMLRINGVKVFTDGGSCGGVALSFELEPGMGTGDLWFTQDELTEMLAEVDAAGYQAAVHAIGDRAVVQALKALETVLTGRPNILRHRMEHVSVIPPDQIARFGELGIIPVLMGEFPTCTPYGPPIPAPYTHMEWPWRALRETNPDLPLAWHSDVPFQSPDPFDHLLGFVTKIDTLGMAVCPPAEWLLDDTLPVEETLSIMTLQSAYALFRDEEVGSLTPGKYADFIVLEKNPLTADPAKLGENRVLLTVVGGRTEYCWPANKELCPGFINRDPVGLPDLRPPAVLRWLAIFLVTAIPLTAMLFRKRYPGQTRQIGGLAGIIGGGIWVIFLFQPTWNEDAAFLQFILPPVLMAWGTAGIASLWKAGKLGTVALWLALLGTVILAEGSIVSDWFQNDYGWLGIMVGILAHSIGLFLFGLANRKGRVLPRWNALPVWVGFLGGPVTFALSFILPEASEIPLWILIGGLGGGWIAMGWLLLKVKTSDRIEASEPE